MKSKIRKTITILFLTLSFLLPVMSQTITAAQTSRSYRVDFYRRSANGLTNKKTWSAGKGTVTLKAKYWIESDVPRGADFHVTLMRNTFPFQTSYEEKTFNGVQSRYNFNEKSAKSFSASWNIGSKSQKYYFITKSASDYVTKKGSGTIYYPAP